MCYHCNPFHQYIAQPSYDAVNLLNKYIEWTRHDSPVRIMFGVCFVLRKSMFFKTAGALCERLCYNWPCDINKKAWVLFDIKTVSGAGDIIVKMMRSWDRLGFIIFNIVAICRVICVELAHSNLGDREDIFITHFIIIIKSEISTLPIVVIFFRGCLPEVVIPSYAVRYIYIYIYIYAWFMHQFYALYVFRYSYGNSNMKRYPYVEASHTTPTPLYLYNMMTSWNGNIFRRYSYLWGDLPATGEFPSRRSVTRSLNVSFDLRLNKRLSKQSRRRWFEMPSWSLWRHCNDMSLAVFRVPCSLANPDFLNAVLFFKQECWLYKTGVLMTVVRMITVIWWWLWSWWWWWWWWWWWALTATTAMMRMTMRMGRRGRMATAKRSHGSVHNVGLYAFWNTCQKNAFVGAN